MSLSSTTILVDPRIDNITTVGDVYNLAVCGTRKRGRFKHRSFLYIGIHNSEIAGLFHDDHFGDHPEHAVLAVSVAQYVPASPPRSLSRIRRRPASQSANLPGGEGILPTTPAIGMQRWTGSLSRWPGPSSIRPANRAHLLIAGGRPASPDSRDKLPIRGFDAGDLIHHVLGQRAYPLAEDRALRGARLPRGSAAPVSFPAGRHPWTSLSFRRVSVRKSVQQSDGDPVS